MPEEVSRTRLIRFTVTAYYEPDPRDYEESDGYGGVVKLLGYNPTVEAMAAFDKYTVDEGGMTPHDITCEKVERDDTEYKFEVVDFIRWDDGSVTEEVVKVLEDHVIDFDEEPDKPSKGVVHEDRVHHARLS